MIYLFFGVLALGLLLFVLDWLTKAKPVKVARLISFIAAFLFIAFAVFLVVTGRGAAVLPVLLAAAISYWRAPKLHGQGSGRAARSGAGMAEAEALEVLGLKKGATVDEIKTAHRALIRKMHPDHGGSAYLAQRINEAKDVLLKGK